jgi:hypothetical protein
MKIQITRKINKLKENIDSKKRTLLILIKVIVVDYIRIKDDLFRKEFYCYYINIEFNRASEM